MPKLLVIFVCTGNVCRSPMAAYLLRARLGRRSPWRVASAGVNAVRGLPPSVEAVQALEEQGIDLAGHRSRPLDAASVDAAALLVVMTGAHRRQIESLYPAAREKTFLLKDFDDSASDVDVHDPIGMSLATYRHVRDEIEAALPGLVHFLEELDVA